MSSIYSNTFTPSLTGRMANHAPAMQNIPVPRPSLEERILQALADDSTKTFGQMELLCGGADPINVIGMDSIHAFSDRLDEALRGLIACGKVILVAKRPELCFRQGTILDRIIREIDLDDAI